MVQYKPAVQPVRDNSKDPLWVLFSVGGLRGKDFFPTVGCGLKSLPTRPGHRPGWRKSAASLTASFDVPDGLNHSAVRACQGGLAAAKAKAKTSPCIKSSSAHNLSHLARHGVPIGRQEGVTSASTLFLVAAHQFHREPLFLLPDCGNETSTKPNIKRPFQLYIRLDA
jgi:hypothetical protein